MTISYLYVLNSRSLEQKCLLGLMEKNYHIYKKRDFQGCGQFLIFLFSFMLVTFFTVIQMVWLLPKDITKKCDATKD